jgi:isocitrate dehydrogenase
MAGSANIGEGCAMFEAVHGSAPDIAGKNIANPSGLLNATIMMLVHIGQGETAALIENAWKKTLEDGIHTGDIYNEKISSKKVGTKEFADAIIKNLGSKPKNLTAVSYESKKAAKETARSYSIKEISKEKKTLVGVDVFFDIDSTSAKAIAEKIGAVGMGDMQLKTISSKGLKLWPSNEDIHTVSDHWVARFMSKKDGEEVGHFDISTLLEIFAKAKLDFIKTENLYNFGENRGYSLAQGE